MTIGKIYIMKNIIYILIIAISLVSCDSGEDMFKDSDQAPLLSIKGARHDSFGKHQKDSLKLEELYYSLDYKVEDEENIELDVQVDSIFRIEIKEDKIIIGAIKEGTSNIYITATDSWGKQDKITFKLTCFKNLSPVAALEIEPLSDVREYKLDASASYDQDQRYGGKVDLYRFFVNEKEIEKTFHTEMNYIFPSTGEYKVAVQVKDNNDQWSNHAQKTITIN